jgi:hypothetical protein
VKYIILTLFLFPFFVHADTKPVINAELLTAVWYSEATIYEGDTLSIYGGIQNHSKADIAGSASFYVDGTSIGSTPFVSHSQSLLEISHSWISSIGTHSVQVKVSLSGIASGTESLLSSESNIDSVTVVARPVPISQFPAVQSALPAIVQKEVQNIDTFTDHIANTLQSLKIATSTRSLSVKNGTELNASISAVTDSSLFHSIYNGIIDILIFVVHHWALTILIILAIILIVRFF